MALSEETVSKLEQLKQYLREEPRRFDMGMWGLKVKDEETLKKAGELSNDADYVYSDYDKFAQSQDADYVDRELVQVLIDLKPPCGTVGCLAGNGAIMAGLVKPSFDEQGQTFYILNSDDARRFADWLGIDWNTAQNLFYFKSWVSGITIGWPTKYSQLYENAGTQEEKVEAACKRIDYFIETGGK